MQIESILSRLTLAALVVLVPAGLLWWATDRGSQPAYTNEIVMVQAMPQPATASGTGALALAEEKILETIGEAGTRVRNVRIVDYERLIACGERIDPGSATSRRFVWLSQLRQVVTDDGGPDFAILVHVCNPPSSPQIQSLGKSGGDTRSRQFD